ncbi:hypothetical protein CTI14_41000 [Methylobacterium radiotolerans]|nr:hypothetical protein CTI14_41000 [Methylobacterium radiotolerans]
MDRLQSVEERDPSPPLAAGLAPFASMASVARRIRRESFDMGVRSWDGPPFSATSVDARFRAARDAGAKVSSTLTGQRAGAR